MPKKYAIDDIRSRFQTVAIDNKYQAYFKPNGDIYDAASKIGLNARFLDEDLGLYVSDAVLPGSSFADIEIAGDRQGITERVPFSRLYDDVTFTFMVDNEYKVMRFFETWTSANQDPRPTVPVTQPERQIDYILFRPRARWRVVEVKVLEEAVASDHRAIFAELELGPSGND